MDDLRAFLTSALGRSPWEDIVEYLDKKGFGAQIARGEKGEDKILSEYIELEKQFHGEPDPTIIEIPGDARCKALGRILAIEASKREDVMEFRESYLKGKLLEPDKIGEWLKARRKTSDHRVEPSGKRKTSGSSGGQVAKQTREFVVDRVYYQIDQTTHSVPIGKSKGLQDLKALVSDLCAVHNVWSEPYVTNYVLTGAPPPVPLARVELQRNPQWPAESRLCLVMDPNMAYKLPFDILTETKDILPEGHRRQKALSAKHLELAVWGEKKRAAPDESWDALLNEWNTQHPDWAYRSASAAVHLARDSRSAWVRVTGRKW